MAASFHLTLRVHFILICLAFMVSEAVCDVCWPSAISKDPVIGFDISLTHGASVVAFPNGTLVNVAMVEADADYQAWIKQSLRDVLNSQSYGSIDNNGASSEVGSNSSGFSGVLRQLLMRFLSRFGATKSTAESEVKFQKQEGLESLLEALKTKTEDYLGKDMTKASITVSGFFTSIQMLILQKALADTSIQSEGCFEKNDFTAALAQRHSQFHFSRKSYTSSTECNLGPFGLEEVISIVYTGQILTFSHYYLYIGKETTFDEHDEYFIAVRNTTVNTTDAAIAEVQGDIFWQNVQSSIRTLMVERRYIHRRTARLVLSGASSQDPDLLNTIRSTLGETVPSDTDKPRAVHIVLTVEELTHNYEEEGRRRRQFGCLYNDHSPEWILKDYEDDLLALVDLPDRYNGGGVNTDPMFIAAHGAALMGLASRTLTCEQRRAMRADLWSYWDFDNRKAGKYLHFSGCDECKEECCTGLKPLKNRSGT